MPTSAQDPSRLSAFVNFPSSYTQELLLSALTSTLSRLSITENPPNNSGHCPQLQWADYDLLFLDDIMRHPTDRLISSYVYRKTLIRKHMLHNAIQEYLAKQRYRSVPTILEQSIPRGWVIDIQFADELDELLVDDLYDLKEDLDLNLSIEDPSEKKWFILKPGMSDKAQGIRMFSSEAELVEIFEAFEPESDDEEDGTEEEEDVVDAESNAISRDELRRIEQLAVKEFPDDEPYEEPENANKAEAETDVQTSQLRHFVIQEYIPRPMLIDPLEGMRPAGGDVQGHKFHLRAYVLMSGTYKLYLARTMLALFSDETFSFKGNSSGGAGQHLNLNAHLTNTCLQASGSDAPPDHLVKNFWDLAGKTILPVSDSKSGDLERQKITSEWLDSTFDQVGAVIAETVDAAVSCGSFGLQLLPNAFEIFGVDLLLSYPVVRENTLPAPLVTLLEFNASPDFFQSGERLKSELGDMFKGVVKLVIAPFFSAAVYETDNDKEGKTDDVSETWKLIGEQKTRGGW